MKGLAYLLLVFFCWGCGGRNSEPAASDAQHQDNSVSTANKIDILVDTDLGGDPDDIQSLFRLLHYSDILNIRGIVSTPCTQIENHPWDTIPNDQLIRNWVMRVDLDHLRSKGHPALMPEQQVLEVVKRGSPKPTAPSVNGSSDGSAFTIELAKQYTPEKPLWVLVWGSLTTVAQALHDDPSIAPNIRLYYIGSSNTQHDSLSRNFVYHFMENQYPQLWWIENGVLPKFTHETFRGVYLGGDQSGEWGNISFVEMNIRGKGTTRNGTFKEKSGDAFPVATWPQGTLKEGDSPSILYLLSPTLAGVGDIDDPTRESWGGQFRQADPERYPNYYIDLDAPPEVCQATINKWRLDYMAHWKERWGWY